MYRQQQQQQEKSVGFFKARRVFDTSLDSVVVDFSVSRALYTTFCDIGEDSFSMHPCILHVIRRRRKREEPARWKLTRLRSDSSFCCCLSLCAVTVATNPPEGKATYIHFYIFNTFQKRIFRCIKNKTKMSQSNAPPKLS